MDLALNNLQRLICHKTQPTKKMLEIYEIRPPTKPMPLKKNLSSHLCLMLKQFIYKQKCKPTNYLLTTCIYIKNIWHEITHKG